MQKKAIDYQKKLIIKNREHASQYILPSQFELTFKGSVRYKPNNPVFKKSCFDNNKYLLISHNLQKALMSTGYFDNS